MLIEQADHTQQAYLRLTQARETVRNLEAQVDRGQAGLIKLPGWAYIPALVIDSVLFQQGSTRSLTKRLEKAEKEAEQRANEVIAALKTAPGTYKLNGTRFYRFKGANKTPYYVLDYEASVQGEEFLVERGGMDLNVAMSNERPPRVEIHRVKPPTIFVPENYRVQEYDSYRSGSLGRFLGNLNITNLSEHPTPIHAGLLMPAQEARI
jgi:hypothetical protein